MVWAPDSRLPAGDHAFRDEIRDWFSDHLVGEFKAVGGVGGPADDEAWDVRLAWERELAADRWLNISWPVEFGGRGGTSRQELLFHIEHAAADAPYWVGVQGRDLFGPTLLEFGTDEQKQRFLPSNHRLRRVLGPGLQRARRRVRPGRRSPPVPSSTATSGSSPARRYGRRSEPTPTGCTCCAAPTRKRPSTRASRCCSCPRHQAGVDVRPIRNIAGGREFCEVFFDEARTAADLVVGEVDGGWKVVMGTLGNERAGATVLPFQASFEREMRRSARPCRRDGSRSPARSCANDWRTRGAACGS